LLDDPAHIVVDPFHLIERGELIALPGCVGLMRFICEAASYRPLHSKRKEIAMNHVDSGLTWARSFAYNDRHVNSRLLRITSG
jgi:hypothetical protein